MFFAKKSKNTLRLRPASSYHVEEPIKVNEQETEPIITDSVEEKKHNEIESHFFTNEKNKNNKNRKSRNSSEIEEEVSNIPAINNEEEKI